MKYPRTSLFSVLAISTLFSGCAITSGLQTYDLPEQGQYKTDQGAGIDVVQLNQSNISTFNIAEQKDNRQIFSLFQNTQKIYRLSSGDVLSIQLWAYPELSSSNDPNNAKSSGYPIDINGNIQLPLLGQIHISGKTLPEANQYLKNQYAKYLKHPDIVVRVLSYEARRYFVNGQVQHSGQFTLNDQPVSMYTALSQAGGLNTENGDNTDIQLIRNSQVFNLNIIDLEKSGLSLHKLLIQPNDTIYVSTRQNQKIYIMGESNKNQSLVLRDQGMTLSDVIGESEGISPLSANPARLYVMRTDPVSKKSTIYHLNLRDFGNFALANQFQMKKNDIVYIDATGLTRWQRVIGQIVPFASAIYSFQLLGNN